MDPAKWISSSGRMGGTKENVRTLNAHLEALQNQVYEIYKSLLQTEGAITADIIKARLTGREEKARMLLDIFTQHNLQIKTLVGNGYAPLTYRRYTTALEHTLRFIKFKYRLDDLEINKLNYEFISDFEFYLRSERKCAHNSTMKYLSNLKKIVLLCVKKEWLSKDPFLGFKLATKEVVREVLTQGELDRILQKEFTSERIRISRDIFLFSCYTGLAYVDVHNLRRSDIQQGADGRLWIIARRQKTETPFMIPLLTIPIKILNHYKDHPQCLNEDRALPVWSNQKLNEYLKEIADVCGIQKHLTYHMARHTFATTVTLNNGVPIDTVSKMLGHKNLKITQHYAKTLERKISEDMLVLQLKYT
ncbi:MAG: site-specific integrase [Flavisolibacter sp.]